MEVGEQTFNGTADFGSRVSATVSRNGDLVNRMYIEHKVGMQTLELTYVLTMNRHF